MQPSWSPHGRRIAYWGVPVRGGGARARLDGVRRTAAKTGARHPGRLSRLEPGLVSGRTPLYFASDRSGSMNLWRVPIDEASGRVLGEPEPVTTSSPWSAAAQPVPGRPAHRLRQRTSDGTPEKRRLRPRQRGRVVGSPVPVTGAPKRPLGRRVSRRPVARLRPASPRGRTSSSSAGRHRPAPAHQRPPQATALPALVAGRPAHPFYSNRSGRYEAWTIRPTAAGPSRSRGARRPALTYADLVARRPAAACSLRDRQRSRSTCRGLWPGAAAPAPPRLRPAREQFARHLLVRRRDWPAARSGATGPLPPGDRPLLVRDRPLRAADRPGATPDVGARRRTVAALPGAAAGSDVSTCGRGRTASSSTPPPRLLLLLANASRGRAPPLPGAHRREGDVWMIAWMLNESAKL